MVWAVKVKRRLRGRSDLRSSLSIKESKREKDWPIFLSFLIYVRSCYRFYFALPLGRASKGGQRGKGRKYEKIKDLFCLLSIIRVYILLYDLEYIKEIFCFLLVLLFIYIIDLLFINIYENFIFYFYMIYRNFHKYFTFYSFIYL